MRMMTAGLIMGQVQNVGREVITSARREASVVDDMVAAIPDLAASV